MNPNLVPTPIVDVNGRQTTVHKKTAPDHQSRSFPAPGVGNSIKVMLGLDKQRKQLIKAIAQQVRACKYFSPSERELVMKKIGNIKDTDYFVALNNALDSITEWQDQIYLCEALKSADTVPNIRTVRVVGNHLDILKEHPGSVERLDRLDAILWSYYGDTNDPRSEVDTLETHLLAKLDYPYGDGYTYSTAYEMHQPYFKAVQEHPDKAEMLMKFVRSNPQNSLSRRAFALLMKVWEEMPDRAEEFTRKANADGIDEARFFLDERGYDEFDKDTITAYLDTAGAISEGWL